MDRRPSVARSSAWLGAAQALEIALQALLPIVLVRSLAPDAFAAYRFAWLCAGTAAAILPFGMLDVLGVLLPVTDEPRRRDHVALTLVYLSAVGGLAAIATALMTGARDSEGVSGSVWISTGIFAGLWLFGVGLDFLPVADERGNWSAQVAMALAVVRTVVAGAVAWHFKALGPVMWALVAIAAIRVGALLYYARRHHRLGEVWPSSDAWKVQVGRALPFGSASALVALRRQADVWVAAALFSAHQFASFSLGTVLSPLVLVVRRAVSSVLLPAMARHHARDDWPKVLETNHRANTAVATIVLPAIAFAWWFGEPLYRLVYTAAYLEAVPVMRVLACGWVLQVIELNSLVLLANQMGFVARINVPVVLLSVATTLTGAVTFGLTGAALGSVVGAWAERALIVRRIASAVGVPVTQLQPWRRLALIVSLCWALAAAGRGAYEAMPETLHPLGRMAAVAIVLLLVYIVILRHAGWWPRSPARGGR